MIVLFIHTQSAAQILPYPKSDIIQGIEIDWSTHQRHAQGSDNFHLTWSDDNHQYGIWGDGGGFQGTNGKYRVSFGVVRIEGGPENYTGFDVYGHPESAEYTANVKGKSWAITSVKGKLYCWVHPDKESGWGNWESHHSESRLYKSDDKGATWVPASWSFQTDQHLIGGAILQFGQDNCGSRDQYVYHYLVHPSFSTNEKGEITELQVPGKIYLLRVKQRKIMKRSAYQFYAGTKGKKISWSKNIEDKQAVFVDATGVGSPVAVSYNPGLDRYLLTTEHSKETNGMLGIFESKQPWGPWFTVHYAKDQTPFGHQNLSRVPANCFFWCFPTKWISSNGRDATLVFTGAGQGNDNDSFNTVLVKFQMK